MRLRRFYGGGETCRGRILCKLLFFLWNYIHRTEHTEKLRLVLLYSVSIHSFGVWACVVLCMYVYAVHFCVFHVNLCSRVQRKKRKLTIIFLHLTIQKHLNKQKEQQKRKQWIKLHQRIITRIFRANVMKWYQYCSIYWTMYVFIYLFHFLLL